METSSSFLFFWGGWGGSHVWRLMVSFIPGEAQSKPGTKMVVIPEPCTGLGRRISAAIYGWDRPLLTFIYPGFDCGPHGLMRAPQASLIRP